jgi:hypothetical protein
MEGPDADLCDEVPLPLYRRGSWRVRFKDNSLSARL